jgi:CubicO group peptidase (beta-lactamase class C family)
MARLAPFGAVLLLVLGVLPPSAALRAQSSPAVLDADLEVIRADYNLPGLTAMAVKGGRILASGAAGVRRQGTATRITVDDAINLASCTKWMTATIAARLVDRGVITWTARVRDLFPNYGSFHPAFADITLEELLAHRAGVQDGATWAARHNAWLLAQTGSITELRRGVAERTLTDPPQVPRDTYLYANQGYAVAGVMLEIASGKSWETLIDEEVFQPLRMTTARLGISFPTNEVPPPGVVGHTKATRASVPVPLPANPPTTITRLQASAGPGGYVVCTLRDWGRFLHMHALDAPGYLTPASVQKLRTPFRGSEGYALGVGAANRPWATPGQALNHSGDIFGENCVFWMSPGRDFVLMAFTNTATGDDSSFAALNAVVSLLIARYQNATPSGPLLDESAPGAPMIVTQPIARTVVAGEGVRFEVAAEGAGPLAYQWRLDGTDLPGATANAYALASVAAAHAGSYSVVVSNSAGSVTSSSALLAVTGPERGRLVNLSLRTHAGAGGQTLIVGFATGGTGTSGTTPLLVRGIGPTLTQFGVGGALTDPQVTLFRGNAVVAANDDWSGGLVPIFSAAGAFALPPGSRDAALHPTLEHGAYSVQISGGGTGIALAEIYDVTPASGAPVRPRLVNVSARATAGAGSDVLIAGFVVGGSGSTTVLVRGIGPTLVQFGVDGALADPQLQLFRGAEAIQANNDWGGSAPLRAAFEQVAAFALPSTSRDAALLATLPPGQYSVQLSGAATASGVALIELYELP